MDNFSMKSKLRRLGEIKDKVHDAVFVKCPTAGVLASVVASAFFVFSPIKGALQSETGAQAPQGDKAAHAMAYDQMLGKVSKLKEIKADFEKTRMGSDTKRTEQMGKYLEWEAHSFYLNLYTSPNLSEQNFSYLSDSYQKTINIDPKGGYAYTTHFGRGGNYRDECLTDVGTNATSQYDQANQMSYCMKSRADGAILGSGFAGILGSVGLGALGFGAAGWATRRRPEKPKAPKN